MTDTDYFIRGLAMAEQLTGITKVQACEKAGVNVTTLRRFLNRENNILMSNLSNICNVGYGYSIAEILALGKKP